MKRRRIKHRLLGKACVTGTTFKALMKLASRSYASEIRTVERLSTVMCRCGSRYVIALNNSQAL